jgi:membrane protease YdiL (CAAX protease family)
MTTEVMDKQKLKKELLLFLIITFTATILITFVIYFISGPISRSPSTLGYTSLQVCMLIPASAALFCMFYFQSPSLTRETKIVFAFFLIYVILFCFESYVKPILGTVGMPMVALQPTSVKIPLVSMIVAFTGILTVIILNLKKKWRDDLEPAKLFWGRNLKNYLIIPLILILITFFSFILNYLLGLGLPSKEFNLYLFFSTLLPSLILSFLVLWPNYFGEEYGWRVYLQDRLLPLLGGYKGVLLLGVIWGLWHAPLILVGLNFPGQPVLGTVLMIISTVIMGIIFSYTVLKTGSIWIAVLLHLILDTIYPVAQYYIATPFNPVFSFGTGIYGFTLLAVLAVILLRSRVWKSSENLE